MKNNKKERGVALLYVLGILALLTVMALAFVSSSLFDQRAAANTAHRQQANNLALAMLDRILLGINENGIDLKYSFLSSTHPDYVESKDMLERLDTYNVIGSNKKSYLFNYHNPSKEHKDIPSKIRWIPHKVKDENGQDIIIGRSAFIIIPYGEGTINANFLSKSGVKEQEQSERRIGVSMDEVNVKHFNESFFSSSIGGKNWADLFNKDDTSEGVLPESGVNGFDDFSNKVFIKTGVVPSENDKTTIEKYFFFKNEKSKEAYWMDLNEDKERDDDEELFHRFYLPGFEDTNGDGFYSSADDPNKNMWEVYIGDANRVDKVLLMERNATTGTPDINLEDVIGGRWSETDANPQYGLGIPWLANFGHEDPDGLKGTFENINDRKRQIAANLIDYCDSDSIPTSDIQPSDWDLESSIPKYTGNERTPYLNEIQAKIVIGTVVTSLPAEDGSITINVNGMLDAFLEAEAVNIYKALDETKPIGTEFKYSIRNLKFRVLEGENTKDVPVSGDIALSSITMTLTTPTMDPPATGYFTNTNTQQVLSGINGVGSLTGYDSLNVPSTTKFEVKFDLDIGNAMLKYDGKNVDYCKINKTFHFEQTIEASVGETVQKTFICSVRAEDPRQNLNSGDWSEFSGEVITGDAESESNIGRCNPHSNPHEPHGMNPGEYAVESVTNPAYDGANHMSTAHIRNAPMISPWELAFIHRGAKWETINLKAYNDSKALTVITVGPNKNKYLDGGGRYVEGDGNILDQIKMTPDTKSGQKLNLVYVKDDVLRGFLGGLYLGCESAFVDGDSAVDFKEKLARGGVGPAEVLDSWIAGVKGVRKSSTRGGIANAGSLHRGDNEASQTEIIGKICNLVEIIEEDIPMEYFDAIILSQSIKDVGDNSPSGLPIKKVFKDSNGKFTVNKEFKAKKGVIDIPVDNDENYIADEVTGECKLLVRAYPQTGESQLISIKTME